MHLCMGDFVDYLQAFRFVQGFFVADTVLTDSVSALGSSLLVPCAIESG